MKTSKERRREERWPVTLLVKCLVSNKEDAFESEMWAKDVTEKGLKLEWKPGFNAAVSAGARARIRTDDVHFEAGRPVTVRDLFYDDDGSPALRGKITWAKKEEEDGWSVGVKFTGAGRSREIAETLHDFVGIVKAEPA
ncbi:MAG: PilZ domain-containing protein [Elusimicrobiota bacterium]